MLMVAKLEVLNLWAERKFNIQAGIGIFYRDSPKISNKSKTIDLTSDLGLFLQQKARFGTAFF